MNSLLGYKMGKKEKKMHTHFLISSSQLQTFCLSKMIYGQQPPSEMDNALNGGPGR